MLIRRVPWNQQPPEGFTVDWSNPLTRGLVFCCVMNGGQAVDLVTGEISSYPAGTSKTPVKIGQGRVFEGVQIPLYFRNFPGLNSGALSLGTWFDVTKSTVTNRYVRNINVEQYGVSKRVSLGPYSPSGSNFHLRLNVNTGTNVLSEGTINLNVTSWPVCIGTTNGSTHNVYTNGVLEVSVSGSSPLSSAVFDTISINGYSGATTDSGAGIDGLAWVHNRILSADEITRISQNPCQLIAP